MAVNVRFKPVPRDSTNGRQHRQQIVDGLSVVQSELSPLVDSNNKIVSGTFTPTISFFTPGDLSVAYSYQIGRYRFDGTYCEIELYLRTSSFAYTTASGPLVAPGLPYHPRNLTALSQPLAGTIVDGWTKAGYTQITPVAAPNDTRLIFIASGSGKSSDYVNAADLPTGGTIQLYACGRFEVEPS